MARHRWIKELCIDLENAGHLKVKYCIHCEARKYYILPRNSSPEADYTLLGIDPDPIPKECPLSRIRRPDTT